MHELFEKNFPRDANKFHKLDRHRHWMCIPICELVLSGFSVLTTIYNTISNMVDSFVILEMCGIR